MTSEGLSPQKRVKWLGMLVSWSQMPHRLVERRYGRARIAAVTDRVLRSVTGLNAEILTEQWWATVEAPRATRLGRRPGLGERAAGYGMSGRIAALPERQPLALTGIWRVTLAGESVRRLVRQDEQDYSSGEAGWQLLQLDDLTEQQIDLYETAMLESS
jgi:hypothetical protein